MDDIERVDIINAGIETPRWWKPWVTAFYIDVPNMLAFDIFERYNLKTWGFEKLDNKELPYIGVYCRIWKWHIVDFFKCMVELRKLILMCGHNDYDDFCNEVIGSDMEDALEVMVDD